MLHEPNREAPLHATPLDALEVIRGKDMTTVSSAIVCLDLDLEFFQALWSGRTRVYFL
jgi:hypothetical protein